MRTLIYTKNEKQEKDLSPLVEKNDDLMLHQKTVGSSELEKLRQAAKFAETSGCDLLLDVQENVQPKHISLLLDALEDKDIPAEILIADPCQKDQQPNEIRALLMLQLLTGEKICGFRSKFRLYPVKLLINVPDSFYDNELFYTRIMIRACRAGYKINNVKVPEYSAPSLLDVPGKTYFMGELFRALVPWRTKRLCERNFRKEKFIEFLLHPLKFIKFLIMENVTPGGLAAAAATGMFLGTLPLLGLHTAAIIYVSIKLRLNKILSVNISHLCMPPFVPFACIEIGYFMRHGKWLTTASFQTVVKELPLRLLDWLLGSLVLAPANAIFFAVITYIMAVILRKALQKRQKSPVEKSQ